MSYNHIETPCFVVDSKDIGESNRAFLLVCDKLGPLWATATSIRKNQSKLRYHLQKYENINISLIEGREYWRIVGVSSIDDGIQYRQLTSDLKQMIARIFLLVRKFLVGEERNGEMYSLLASSFAYAQNSEINSEEIFALELLTVVRILMLLGYVDKNSFSIGTDINRDSLYIVGENKKEILKMVNSAIKASGL